MNHHHKQLALKYTHKYNLFTIDWKNQPFPQYLQHLIQINDKSNALSPKKRKAESGIKNPLFYI